MRKPRLAALLSKAKMLLRAASFFPLGTLVLTVVLLLPSSAIVPSDALSNPNPWLDGYASWWDVLIALALAWGVTFGQIQLFKNDLLAFVMIFVIGVISWLAGLNEIKWTLLQDIFVHWLRIVFGYLFVKSIVIRVGSRDALFYINVIGFGLCCSSIFVAFLAYEKMPRIYSAGMTVASFGQILAFLIVVNAYFKNWKWVALFVTFLIATLSRTSIVMTVFLLILLNISTQGLPNFKKILISILMLGMLAGAIFLAYEKINLFALAVDNAFRADSIETIGSRSFIWNFAGRIWKSGEVPWHGVGLYGTPSLLWGVRINPFDHQIDATHFHSILIELIFGAGILGMVLLFLPAWRLYIAWRTRSLLGVLLYVLFYVTQMIDFTLYRPKEELIWGMILGFAEAHIWFNKRKHRISSARGA